MMPRRINEVNPKGDWEEKEMEAEWEPSDSENDVKTVLEAHDLLPEGPLLDEALGLTSLYADLIRQLLGKLPESVNRQKAILAVIEEGLMQDGIIPNSHQRRFVMPDKIEEDLKGGPDVTKK
jgi:hypothetical protein